MSEDNNRLPENEREQGSLDQVLALVPLGEFILRLIEVIIDLVRGQ
ncbi:hypothetical protein FACS1894167_02700 [Synergistales bacterium]|nr:hypothetical protein FACS1894167_02700 [Synergistales bacterium]GHV54965.1 hypothetical protein FACS1894216_16060 [Synergistales bacterium]